MELKQEAKVTDTKKRRTFISKLGRVLAWILASLIFLIILLVILIQTPFVQNFARKKVVSYLENKLKTRVEIGKLDIKFPTALSLQNVFFEDQSKDTLLYGGEIKVDISMFKLISSNIEIQEIALNNIVMKVKRLPPDSVFNFQYMVDAFAGTPKKTSAKPDTSSMKINIDRILVNNTKVIYKDAFTGNDMNLVFGHFDTKINTFDPSHLLFDIPTITLKGLKGYFYQEEPLQKSLEKTVAEAAAPPEHYLQFLNKEMNFSDIDVVYKNIPSHLNTSFVIGKALIHPKTIDLKNSIITLNDATLTNSDIAVETASTAPVKKSLDTVLTVAPTPSFKIIANAITIKNSNIKYDDQSLPRQPKGIDYSHLYLQQLSLNATGLQYSTDTTIISVKSAAMKEKSGFILDNLSADFSMNPTGVSLQNLLIQTPGSEIKKSAIITYPSLAAIAKNPGVLGLDLDLQNSKITVKDLLTFMPSMSAQTSSLSPNSTLYVDARITGKVDNLNFQKLMLRGLTATDINATGVIKGLPDPKKLNMDLVINKFQSSKKDLLSFIPKNTLPPNITLPESMSASGRIKGGMNNLNTNIAINTSLGSAKINGSLINITDKNKAQYDLVLNAGNLQLGMIMQNPKQGSLSGDFKVEGNGYDPKTANAAFDGTISNITLNNYNYKNIKANGSIIKKVYKINAAIHDPNLDAVVAANGNFSGKYPTVRLNATVDSIKTFPLHLTPQPVFYHGLIESDFTNIDPDSLAGNLLVTHSVLVNNGQRFTVDSLALIADNTPGNQSLILKTDFFTAAIKGKYKLTQLANVFQQAIDPYFSMSKTRNTQKVDFYHFSIEAGIVDNPALRAFLPQLTQLKPINLSGNFSSDNGWNIFIKSPRVVYGTYIIDSLNLNAVTKNGALVFNTSLQQFKSGTSLSVYATTLDGTLQNNNLDFSLKIKDQKSVNKYILSGSLDLPSADDYVFSLKPDNLLLNYEKWTINADNKIQYLNKDINAHNFILSKGAEQLSINSMGPGVNEPLQIDFKNFTIATLTGFVQSDSLMVNGMLNGNAIVKNIQTQPTFTTDITVNNLSVYKDTIGNLTAKVNNNVANTYHADVSLTGRGNEVNVNGDYLVNPTNSSYDFVVNIVTLQMKALEGFTDGALKDTRGNLYGKIALNGSLQKPNIDGKLQFNNTAFNVRMLNNLFKIDKEAIAVINNKGIEFNNFTIHDTANNAIVIDGAVNTPDFFNYSFDLKITAKNFQAVNSTSKDNQLFYGKMVFSTNLTIKGTPTHPVVDGDLTIDDKTNFTVVLPQEEPGVESRDGIVRFVDKKSIAEDSLFMAPYDSLKVSPLVGYDVSLNINIVKEAVFNVIVDAGNGDFLRIKGAGQLTGGVDASGKITLVGSYEIEEGSYDLSFNFLKRKFIIQKGSRIVWTGEPTTAQIDVTAIYIANTAPLDLLQGQTVGDENIYKQKLPFEVHLLLQGEILKPLISFDIILPEEKNYNVSKDIINTVETKLAQMRQETGEMNKQVFALLLLNRFVGENPFASSGGSFDAGTFAMQSASRLLSEQLNQLTQNLVQGVDINFDLATTQDYTTGSAQNRTDLNVGVSKRLLSDRLTVTVGSDFELQGPAQTNQGQNNLAGNIAINYKLSKDGRYMLRGYRKNDYTGEIEGYVIETGIGFIISVDYNKFKEIFTTKEQRRKKREISKENKKTTKADNAKKENEQTITPPSKAPDNGK
ncbi:MAG: translocation/assembly module TamB domain-containing protein [Bacteroidota bacterium]|nr:translocation/assembly module TamB domain-containing protein [Bacteroidota bacterium]